MDSAEPAIELDGVTKRFGERVVLDAITLRVPRGRMHGLIGLNGAGKTTAIRVLLGLLAPNGGRARVLGRASAKVATLCGRLAAALHGTGVDGQLTCHDNLRAHALRHGRRGVDCAAALARLGLSHVASRRAAQVSQGERQRLTLARALLLRPEAIVLDEPLTHLDPGAVQRTLDVLRAEVREHGVTVLLSSHQLEHVERSVDSLALIHGGRVVKDGAVADLLAAERSSIIVTVDAPDRALSILRASPLVASAEASTDGLTVARPRARLRVILRQTDPAPLNRALVEAGIAVSELSAERRTLDEAFRAITAAPLAPGAEASR